MSVSISDVAKRANVSISTVSRVINGRQVVHEATRARVMHAIQQLGFTPNAFARGLMLRRSEIVGLMLPDLHGEFYSEIIRGAGAAARRCGYNLLLTATGEREDGPSLLNALQQRTLLDGVAVMVSEVSNQIEHALADFRLPFVVLDDEIEGQPHDSVIIDQAHGARALTRHLLERRGVRRIVFVGGPAQNVDTMTRLGACRDVLREAGLALAESDVAHLDYTYDTAYRFSRERVAAWQGPHTCVFAANDEMAAGVVAAAVATGVRVPEALLVVGFDDTRIAQMTRPALTTVRVPMAQMGAQAIELLCQRLADPERLPSKVTLQPELVIRESCVVATS